jgi:murein L,D-transpeptidase YafK
MIHGMPNGFGWMSPLLSKLDWTEGCIAVSNTAMEEITLAITVGAKIINPYVLGL